MRNTLAALVVLGSMGTIGDVYADVGPAPKCPDGTYSAYLKGRRCVKNGYVLQEDAQGHVQEVSGPVPVANPEPVNQPVASDPPPAPAKKAGGCAMVDRGSAPSALGIFTALGLLLLARRRRSPAVAASHRASI